MDRPDSSSCRPARSNSPGAWWWVLPLCAACGGGEAVADGKNDIFVGTVKDTDARIGLVRDEARWAAYVCGGPSTLRDLTGWFQGAMGGQNGGRVAAQIESKALEVNFLADEASGTLVAAGPVLEFTAERVRMPGPYGLFERLDRGCRTGLVVPPAGAGEPQGVHCAERDAAGMTIAPSFEQVTPITPLVLTDRGIEVRLTLEDRTLFLLPVELPLH